jgi:hypothetical protein
LAGLAARGARPAALVLLIAVAALVGDKYQFSWIKGHWRADQPTAHMVGLWTSEDERKQWHQVLEIIKDHHASVLSTNGEGLTTIMAGFAPAENMFLSPGIPLASDLNRKLDQVASAQYVLIRNNTRRKFLDLWPQFHEALDGCELIYSSPRYLIYRRLGPPRMPTTPTDETGRPRTGPK